MFVSIGLFAVFFLPYFIPSSNSFSVSSIFGFNNRVSLICFVTVASVFAYWTRGAGLFFPSGQAGPPLSRRSLYWTLAISAALALSLWLYTRPFFTYREDGYFLDRYAAFAAGKHLYTDFEFAYGPLLFYLPVGLARILRVSLPDAYYLSWILQWILGVAVLWQTVKIAASSSRHALTIYLFFWGSWILSVVDEGPNYTPLRFSAGLLAALLIHRLNLRSRSPIFPMVVAAFVAALLLFYSAEQGMVFSAATLTFFLLNARTRLIPTLVGACMHAAIFAAAFAIALHIGELAMLCNFTGGSLNFPLLISFQNIVLLLLLIVALCVVWGTLLRRRFDHPLLYLSIIGGAGLPAAFGRCDTGHIFINTMGALLAVLIALSTSTRLWKPTKFAFLFGFLALNAGSHLLAAHAIFSGPIKERLIASGPQQFGLSRVYAATMRLAIGRERANAKLAKMHAAYASQSAANSSSPFLHTHLLAPFGTPHHAHPLPSDGLFLSGYYIGYLPLANPAMPAKKISELEAESTTPLLIPDTPFLCEFEDSDLRRGLRQLLLPLYLPPARHHSRAGEPLCAYINAHYQRSSSASPIYDYTVWLPTPSPAPSPAPLH